MRRKSLIRTGFALILASVMVFCSMPISAAAASSEEIRQQLKELKEEKSEIQNQINAIRRDYNANAADIRDLVDQKSAIDQEIALLHDEIANTNEQIAVYSQLIADTQDELDEASDVLTALNQKHKERIRAMEEEGKVTYWQVLFESSSFMDLLDRLNMMQEIAASDQKRLDEIRKAADVVQTAKDQMSEEKDGLEQIRLELAASEDTLAKKRTESDDILRELAAKQEEFELLLDESEAMQDELMREIAAKQKELTKAEYEENLAKLALQGTNPPSSATWLKPVSGYTITSAFGMRIHPVYGYQLMHNGVDMACPTGTPIYATRAGTVTTASFQAGGAGYYVNINHGDGFSSIYMHMTHYVVASGQKVSAGQLIGYVGSTGVSTGPHLHFGISYAGTYVNPLAYV